MPLLVILIVIIIIIPSVPYTNTSDTDNDVHDELRLCPVDFNAFSNVFGPRIPVMVHFSMPFNEELVIELERLSVGPSLRTYEESHIGKYYLITGPTEGLYELWNRGMVDDIMVQTSTRHIHSTRDVSIPEISADDVWKMVDQLGHNITGEGILIADLDTGVDWRHPDLWFPDNTPYRWLEVFPDGQVTNGSDWIDINNDMLKSLNETLYIIDINRNGVYDVSTDWIWIDNVTQDGVPQPGEPFFVAFDEDGDDVLDPNEELYMLSTPKTRYIVEKNNVPPYNIVVWERGVNLTVSTHLDVDGHGTAVAGILLGGQIGFRKYVGVAPNAELMMLRVLDAWGRWLTVEEALAWAYNHGADVILTEIGSWTYEYLDGSSAAETAINTIVDAGVPVISPSGNLGGKDKHALFTANKDVPYVVDFSVPPPDGVYVKYDIENVYITILSRNNTDFAQCNFSLIFNLQGWGGPPSSPPLYLHPKTGYYNFSGGGDALAFGGRVIIVHSFISISDRQTRMCGIWIHNNIPTVNGAPWHILNITPSQTTTFHAFISDDRAGWTGGAVWKSDVNNAYHITWPSTADKALSVASYRTRGLVAPEVVGGIAGFSSRGPRIDETLKQGVAAPGGYDIISDYTNASAWSNWFNAFGALPLNPCFGGYRLFSGTSASGPHVAGCAALIIQLACTMGTEVKNIIENTTTADGFTGAVPNSIWGHGKLNVSAAILFVMNRTPPAIHDVQISPQQVRYYDTVTVTANVTDDIGLDTVLLRYDVDEWTDPQQVVVMTLSMGKYSATIGTFAYSQTVYYAVYANNTAGSSVQTSVMQFSVDDDRPPVLSGAWRNSTAADHNVAVSIDVTEEVGASGVDTVWLNYTVDDWAHNLVVVLTESHGTFSGIIPGQPDSTHVQYCFVAKDVADNWNMTDIFEYITIDVDAPIIGTPTRDPIAPNNLEVVTITVSVHDNTGVSSVILSYYNGTSWVNVTMILTGDVYQGQIPALPVGTQVQYRVYAGDTRGIWAISPNYTYTVQQVTTTTTTTTEQPQPDYMLLGLLVALVFGLVMLSYINQRRRK